MIRSILSLPNNPAVRFSPPFSLLSFADFASSPSQVVFVGAFALQSQTGDGGMLNGGDAHMALSSFYDVPQVGLLPSPHALSALFLIDPSMSRRDSC